MVKFWEKFFLKKRSIFAYDSLIESFENIYIFSMANVDVTSFADRDDYTFRHHLMMRCGDPEWVLFFYKVHDDILGYSFLHIPTRKEWSDSLPTLEGEARVCSNFVYPEHRGRKILSEIAKCQIRYAVENNLKLWCVVENSNTSAMRATMHKASISRANYLIKIAGINVVSILVNPTKVFLLIGSKRAKR